MAKRRMKLLSVLAFFMVVQGCAALPQATAPAPPAANEEIGAVKLREFMISPGDEINITVYKHEDLNRKLRIPPDGRFFFPIIGEIDTTGKGLRELREIITKGLAEQKEQVLIPGDEISIDVYGHNELARKVTVPTDGIIFYPLVGEVKVVGRPLREVRETIANGLEKYKKFYLMPGDEISITVYRHDELNRKTIIPPDGTIYVPLAGEIKAEGKSLGDLRSFLTVKFSRYFEDPQVGIDLVSTSAPKIVVDPQVSIDIVKLSNPKMIPDAQVGIEVTDMGGHRVFVLGEVERPGVFVADGTMGVLEAVTMAGGPTLDAEQTSVLLIRGGMEKPKELKILDIQKALAEGDLSQNPILAKGDIIFLPRTFISNVDRFFGHLSNIISPIVDIERGFWLGQNIETGPRGVVAVP